ncbi:leukocyte elastase inhibitor-like isoform X2 [Chanos chanos]|uniref:Leukocyte elastase inhibitor n=1 Tax=Chanos chanos TaxID=29144 RepID=A0A6J2UUX8_CHACN|nr:leukocyte elastase inhibitor-like isoform X2 [Chanos chanos]
MASLTLANISFSVDLFKRIRERNETGNVFYSPLSISSALAMVYLGAKGNTAAQMSECVPFSTDIHVGFSKLICELQRGGAPYSLSLANRLYGEQSFKFVEEFLKDTQKYYGAELDAVDFKSNPEAVRKNINGWVEKQTQAKIKDLLIKGIVCQDTRLVLVNAVYFKGFWENKFVEHNTREIQFKLKKNETKPVQMMFQTGQFPLAFIPEVNIQILELPYKGKDLSMLIMLPNGIADDTTGLEKLERELTHENFVKWTKSHQMNHVVVEVGLPRFRMEETHDLKDLLISMGMVDAFDQHKCDFSGMSPNKDLVLSKVVHKCFVDVNEEGTEAAGAAGATLTERCGTVAPKLFVADHPFLFFIRHNPTQSILFCGRYSSP